MIPKIHLIAGARPNFMKIAPLYHALSGQAWCQPVLVHTGQHYSANMSDVFFTDLRLPAPDHHLEVGSGSHAEQTGTVMVAYEKLCLAAPPAWVVVVGDVNSTLACAITAKKLCLPVAHLEAGLRSRDRSMPEEINRLVTDSISDLLWTPSPDADENLLAEGVDPARIECVGNIMIDSFEMMQARISAETVVQDLGLKANDYAVATLHRPANVDHAESLGRIVDSLVTLQQDLPMIFPVHPRTQQALIKFGLEQRLTASGVRLVEPMGYVRFMALVSKARFAVTDSGGLQEETSHMGVPCLTLRPNTERPITVTEGTNRLVDTTSLVAAARSARRTAGRNIALWDGNTAQRVSHSLRRHCATPQ
ncbi:MAG: non-hydrolyzing UDP-N-acetylglucosamine 2-epimerase [Ferrovibrio sp.]